MSSQTETKKPAEEENLTEQEVVAKYNELRKVQQELMSRISSAEGEAHELQLVLEVIKPLNGDRKCHRQVGGVLIEKTVKDTLPEVEQQFEGINTFVKNLNTALDDKSKEMEELVAKYKIRPVQGGQGHQGAVMQAGGDNKGVLA